jgi:predicted MPP superfamily phosphohydrolase
LTIVQITDLHLGILGDEAYFQQVVDTVNAVDPDIIVSTGDLVDMQLDHLHEFKAIMSGLRARLGKYAVYGNHEALAGLDASRAFTETIGFTLLSNSGTTIDNLINLVGVNDPAVERWGQTTPVDEPVLLKQFDNGLFTLLLKHQPRIDPASQGLFDLQLSGHTHGGQIFPFGLLIHLFYKEPFGFSRIDNKSSLYVSRGTGTWGPPMRVLASPEITIVRLQPGEQAS